MQRQPTNLGTWSRMRNRVSPSTAISVLALFFSLGGTGLAASRYLITSPRQIAPSVRHALRGNRGPAGPAGLQGPAGAQGPAGTVDWSHVYFRAGGNSGFGAAGQDLTSGQPDAHLIQACNPGDHVLEGGFDGTNEIVTTSELVSAFPFEWQVDAHLEAGQAQGYAEAWVLCAVG